MLMRLVPMYLSDKYIPKKVVTNVPTYFLFEGPFLKSNNFFFHEKTYDLDFLRRQKLVQLLKCQSF